MGGRIEGRFWPDPLLQINPSYKLGLNLETLIANGIHSWQVQLTVAMGRAADEPSLILEPFQVLEVMPLIARVKKKATPRKRAA